MLFSALVNPFLCVCTCDVGEWINMCSTFWSHWRLCIFRLCTARERIIEYTKDTHQPTNRPLYSIACKYAFGRLTRVLTTMRKNPWSVCITKACNLQNWFLIQLIQLASSANSAQYSCRMNVCSFAYLNCKISHWRLSSLCFLLFYSCNTIGNVM